MKIIIASDLHGNLEALQCLLSQKARHFLFAGDIIDYGPDSLPCLEIVRQRGWSAVRGNHDHALAYGGECGCRRLMRELSVATRRLVQQQISTAQLQYLRELPRERYLELGGQRFYLTHAVPGDLQRYLPLEVEENILRQLLKDIEAQIIIWGHTHLPYLRRVGEKLIVNPGSLGQPRDGIAQASWAEWEDGQVRLRRSPYSLQLTLGKIRRSSLPARLRRQLEHILLTGKVEESTARQPQPPDGADNKG